jgi:hypothetical protein
MVERGTEEMGRALRILQLRTLSEVEYVRDDNSPR